MYILFYSLAFYHEYILSVQGYVDDRPLLVQFQLQRNIYHRLGTSSQHVRCLELDWRVIFTHEHSVTLYQAIYYLYETACCMIVIVVVVGGGAVKRVIGVTCLLFIVFCSSIK